jgi:hypothetical protein
MGSTDGCWLERDAAKLTMHSPLGGPDCRAVLLQATVYGNCSIHATESAHHKMRQLQHMLPTCAYRMHPVPASMAVDATQLSYLMLALALSPCRVSWRRVFSTPLQAWAQL